MNTGPRRMSEGWSRFITRLKSEDSRYDGRLNWFQAWNQITTAPKKTAAAKPPPGSSSIAVLPSGCGGQRRGVQPQVWTAGLQDWAATGANEVETSSARMSAATIAMMRSMGKPLGNVLAIQ